MFCIYEVNLLRIEDRTPESFEKELQLENVRYNREISLERYKERVCSFNQLLEKYNLCNIDANAYFLSLTDAKNSVINNCADINAAGCYNYACIISYPIGLMYGTSEPNEFYLFKYNREKDEYVEISSSEDVYKFTAKEFGAEFLVDNEYKEEGMSLFKESISKIEELIDKNSLDIMKPKLYQFMYFFTLQFDMLHLNAENFNKFEAEYDKDMDSFNLIWNTEKYKFIFHFYKEDENSFCEEVSLLKLKHLPLNKDKMVNTIMRVLLELN